MRGNWSFSLAALMLATLVAAITMGAIVSGLPKNLAEAITDRGSPIIGGGVFGLVIGAIVGGFLGAFHRPLRVGMSIGTFAGMVSGAAAGMVLVAPNPLPVLAIGSIALILFVGILRSITSAAQRRALKPDVEERP